MRLAAALLIPCALGAQQASDLPWRAVDPSPTPLGSALVPSSGPLSVRVAADGVVRVFDAKGIRRLRRGLPGRPVKVWRDGGLPVSPFLHPLAFPVETPLRKGLGALHLDAPDFRPALAGLLWVLDDGGRTLTLLHPATGQSVGLRLPELDGADLRFLPDRLELQGPEGRAWALPWIALLPQLLQLARPLPGPPPGGAMDPYPSK